MVLQYVTLWNHSPKGKNMPRKEVITAEEVAKYLRIHPYTVRRLAREGKLPGFKIGGQWRFKKEEIDKPKGTK